MKSILSHRTFSGLLALALALGLWLPASACADQAKPEAAKAAGSTQVLATVDGKPITEADIREKAAAQFSQIDRDYENQKYQLLDGQLQQMIQDRLLDAEAASKGVTKEQLLADLKPAEVNDAAIDAFYEENKARIPQPKEQVAAQIRQYLEQRGQFEAREKLFASLEGKYKVEKKLEPLRADVAATGPSKGPETAPVTIVEFSDFQCPFCSRINPTLDQVVAKYGDKVRIVFRQFPLGMHAQAQKAAEASLCANDQGKFWELHDHMFQNQQKLAVEDLKTQAKTMGMNADTFNSCLDSNKYASQVAKDMEAGSAAGVTGTPALFVNGRFINGAVPLEQITVVIDDELRRKGA